jgi:hypothetical protein
MKFKTTEQKINTPIKKKTHWKMWLIVGLMLISLISMAGYGVKSFFDKYYIVSPVQDRKVKLIIPTPTPTKAKQAIRVVEPVYASEPKVWNTPVKTTVMSYFDEFEQDALETLVFRESSWNPQAVNANGGACGLFQALPCAKMGCELTDIDCQAKWGKAYIEARYGSANKALEFHNQHGWY